MSNILKELKLTELSLVDNPANPLAMAPIFKSDSKGEKMEDVIKMSDDMKGKLKPYMDKGMSMEDAMKAYENDMKKSMDDLKAENERLRKALIENEFVIKADTIEKKAPKEFIEIDGEQILKSDVPAPILKRLEEAEVAKVDLELTKKAEETLPNFDIEVAKGLMKFDLDEAILQALIAADAAFALAVTEKGMSDTDGDMTDPVNLLEKRVAEIAKAESITKEQAFAKFSSTKEGQELVTKAYYKKEAN